MAVVNYTVEHDAIAGYVKVEWEFSSSGEVSPFPNQDEGQPFDCSGLRIVAAGTSGDFGGFNDNGKIDVLVAHEILPEIFFSLFAFDRDDVINKKIKMQLDLSRLTQIKPIYNRNNRTVKLSVMLAR